jgi:hypothetical protein
VLCVAPGLNATAASSELADLSSLSGVEPVSFDYANQPGFWSDFADGRNLTGLFKHWRPHCAIGFGARSGPLTVMAARRAGATVTALNLSGMAAIRDGRAHAGLLHKSLAARHVPVFESTEDRRIAGNMFPDIALGNARVVAPGGVDLAAIPERPLPPIDRGFVFAMVASLSDEAGLIAYCQAARTIRSRAPHVQFLFKATDAARASPRTEAALSAVRDIIAMEHDAAQLADFLAGAHVVVALPEHDARVTAPQTALALGRPLIVSAVPDFFGLVDESVNGHRIAAITGPELTEVMFSILRRLDLVAAMGRASRAKAVRSCDSRELLSQLQEAVSVGAIRPGKVA